MIEAPHPSVCRLPRRRTTRLPPTRDRFGVRSADPSDDVADDSRQSNDRSLLARASWPCGDRAATAAAVFVAGRVGYQNEDSSCSHRSILLDEPVQEVPPSDRGREAVLAYGNEFAHAPAAKDEDLSLATWMRLERNTSGSWLPFAGWFGSLSDEHQSRESSEPSASLLFRTTRRSAPARHIGREPATTPDAVRPDR
jgi:hypothetical protein